MTITTRPLVLEVLVFNLADAAITVGVLILLARSLLSREKPAQAAGADNDTATETV